MMTKKWKRFSAVTTLLMLLVISCKKEANQETAMNEKIPGIILDNMDRTVSPKEDFYRFVNGTWMETNTIPDDESRWGGFGVLRKSTRADMLNILNTSKELGTYTEGSDQKKALLIYEAELDTLTRTQLGVTPLEPFIEAIEGINSIEDMQRVMATNVWVSAPFAGMGAGPDLNNSKMNTCWVTPGGLGLQRDYYLGETEKDKTIRAQYKAHIARMLQFIDYSETDAQEAAALILKLETALAEPRLDKVARRDLRNMNNPRTLQELHEMAPVINWKQMLDDMGVEKQIDTVMVMQPNYMTALNNFLKETPLEDLKTLMVWRTLDDAAQYLSPEMEKANWEFYGKTINGSKAMRPAEERALGTVDGTVGEALGQLYVQAKFPPEAKLKAEEMIDNVIKAFKIRIDKLDWMSPETKLKAIEKLDKLTVKIAYPDEWRDYSELDIEEGNSYAEHMQAVRAWLTQENLNEINEPIDKKRWGMSPQTVNAYFNPINNEIVFPAAILQPPFYNYTADEAVNYGGIGAVIGHEISHAFDDSGARFDADGNLNNWWTPEDLEEFQKRGKALNEQYSGISVLDSVYVNGAFTLGENIGDLGGVLAAYDGLQLYFEDHGRPEPIDGFTAEQRFFMSWATVWRTLIREDALRNQIISDPHSPGHIRAVQPLKNVDAFYEAFDIKEGDGMFLPPEERVRIW
jgi:putative endopeptidase